MKHTILKLTLLFILIASSTIANAGDGDSPWAVGIKGGLNTSFKHSDKAWGKKTGYNAIAFANYTFYDYLFVRAGFGYTTKGAVYKNTSTVIEGEIEITNKVKLVREVGYLHAPLYVGVSTPITQNLTINSMIGGYVEYGVNFKNSYTTNSTAKETIKGQQNTYIKKGDIGFVFAAEAEYKSYLFGVTYEMGLRNGSFGYGGGNTLYRKWHNRNASIYLGYKFNL